MILATLCYIRKDGKTLMLHRVKKENDIHEGKWNGLGGKIQSGESPEECIIREVREESGLSIHEPILKGILTFPGFDGENDWYVYVYEAHRFDGTIISSDEGNLEWIENSNLAELDVWEGDRIFHKWIANGIFFSGKFVYKKGKLISHDVVFHNQTPG